MFSCLLSFCCISTLSLVFVSFCCTLFVWYPCRFGILVGVLVVLDRLSCILVVIVFEFVL